MEARDALLREFTALRHGYGIQATNLRRRVGPELALRCDITEKSSNRDIRRQVTDTVHRHGRALPEPDRRAIDIALGVEAPYPSLAERVDHLARTLTCAERTARRRVNRAFELLADEMTAIHPSRDEDRTNPENGWYVRTFDALLRLDTATPELIEQRDIVATRDGLRTILARMSLPRRPEDPPTRTALLAEVQHGARIIGQERQGEGHFRYLLELPRPLAAGERHDYTIAFRIPEGQPMRTHYAFVPYVSCERFRVRVRFDPAHLPAAVWRLDRLMPRVMMDHPRPGPPIPLDGAAEAELEFHELDQGYGYGLAWLPGE
jgi:hypothetical protein